MSSSQNTILVLIAIVKDRYGIENFWLTYNDVWDLPLKVLSVLDHISIKFESLCVEIEILLVAIGADVAYNGEPTVSTFIPLI